MKHLALYYFNKNNNFGDALNLEILNHILTSGVVHQNANKAELVAIGSLMESFLGGPHSWKSTLKRTLFPTLAIWGSGFIGPPGIFKKGQSTLQKEVLFRKVKVLALRGKLSQSRMENILGKDLGGVVLGDPGLLVGDLYPTTDAEKQYELGIIAHYADAKSSAFTALNSLHPEACFISVFEEPLRVIEKMVACKTIASSAMHGLIVADALNIPNAWLRLSNAVTGGAYKFADYYSALGQERFYYLDMRKGVSTIEPQWITDHYSIDLDRVEQIKGELRSVLQAWEVARG